MQEILVDGEDVCFYELDALRDLPGQIRSLLEDREHWEQMQRHAYERAAKTHTWENRAKQIHEEILCKIQ